MKMLAFALLLLATACATTEGYRKVMDSWVGQDANHLVRKWGPPVQTFQMPNGNSIYVYYDQRSYTTPVTANTTTTANYYGGSTSTTQVSGGDTYVFSCKTQFEVGPEQRIVSYRFQGNRCRAY